MLSLVLLSLLAAGAQAEPFVGTERCIDCHQAEHSLWRDSHHDLAMQAPAEATVLGDFNGATFNHRGATTTFSRDGDNFIVRTAGEDGSLQDFPVRYVFGVEPLQQYLLPLSRGRLQAFDIAWDTRPAEAGGQRWFHLNPEEVSDHSDPLHWTGPYMNWNTRCAECHSTNLEKRHDADSRSFDTRFSEVDVGCEACHGPGERHLQLVQEDRAGAEPNSGFPTALAQRGDWVFSEQAAIAQRTAPLKSNAQIDGCGRCHSRRGNLGTYHYGKPLLDTHRLALPEEPLYYHDGQIRDEVFVHGSFIQSRMHQAGVVCSNCHEPHSLQLRAPGNGVCAQCHKAEVYAQPEHHHHAPDSAGADCANCHMPATTYMVVDPRRDHSMRIPRPDLSVVMGVPNACNQCHTDRDAQWALDATRAWGVRFSATADHPARALQQLAAGNRSAVPRLQDLVRNSDAAPVMRATALAAIGRAGEQPPTDVLVGLLQGSDPLLRLGAVQSLEGVPLGRRYQILQPLITDSVTSVRMAVAEALAPVPLAQLNEGAEPLRTLFAEYVAIQGQHADMPGVQLQLGLFLLNRGDLPAAERAYREALHLNPQLLPGRLNLADLLRSMQRDDEAREQLQAALAAAPDSGAALHAMGLLETRTGNREQGLALLQRAAELEQQGVRHRYVYAIALHDSGEPRAALSQLQAVQRATPGDPGVLLALVNYSEELGEMERALHWARELLQTAPENPAYQALQRRLARGGAR
ncbi:HEAT repeat domain-containing protein [Haliea sp. E1-2-M8]|uniref:tetratricopeptide repeat protein n=1 Tax=Haliea sp. E1-2-M8 TaxID=3064706 RepID=UPI002719BFBB|nr:tetratricopeptide repeat protein [Haliea sp. E1-2-M8]MDO8862754.1 HEAT repeat domain-containing protein [Haliea sp. E1-2-M8]